jgi:hypothetical protein
MGTVVRRLYPRREATVNQGAYNHRVSREHPRAGCYDLSLGAPRRLPDAAVVALEDYALTLARGQRADAIPAPAGDAVDGVHVCGAEVPPSEPLLRDLAAFARELAAERDGLGWS